MENAFKYFDDDNSGVITRGELVKGFELMKVTMPQKLIETLFVVLDRDCDNEITLTEFESVFDKYLGTGGAVKDLAADDIMNDNPLLNAKDAAKMAKQMN